jgi:hypothetical protein
VSKGIGPRGTCDVQKRLGKTSWHQGRRPSPIRQDDAHKTSACRRDEWEAEEGPRVWAIPQSVRPVPISENLDVVDYALSADEAGRIDDRDSGTSTWRTSAELDDQYLSSSFRRRDPTGSSPGQRAPRNGTG